jgi:hypothetical protein
LFDELFRLSVKLTEEKLHGMSSGSVLSRVDRSEYSFDSSLYLFTQCEVFNNVKDCFYRGITTTTTTTTTGPLRSHWNIGPQQLSVAEVSVAFKLFIETGLLALCSNPPPPNLEDQVSIT